ncbi:MAG: EboA domain-containing protein [Bradymonadia bacterium]
MDDTLNETTGLLRRWLGRQLTSAQVEQLDATLKHIREAGPAVDRLIFKEVSLAIRKYGKSDLELTADDFDAAAAQREGWHPVGWTVDQTARLLMILTSALHGTEGFVARVEKLFRTADVGELVAFYQGLPLFPESEAFVARAAEGCRTNMKAVFEAVSHHNPYPSERFDEVAWNHLVLKSIFIGSTLFHIQGLDARQNPELTRMLCDYAHERWAASRTITPELWRCTSRYATDETIADLKRVLASDDLHERQAGALALAASPHPDAGEVLKDHPELSQAIETGSLTWASLVRDAGLI